MPKKSKLWYPLTEHFHWGNNDEWRTVINKDLTRTHLNQYKDEVQKGGKVTVLTRGWVVTSNVEGSPGPGDVAYASNSSAGAISNYANDATGSGNLAIGRWASSKDADGYAKVYVNLPNHGA